jgi:hypothetical protein
MHDCQWIYLLHNSVSHISQSEYLRLTLCHIGCFVDSNESVTELEHVISWRNGQWTSAASFNLTYLSDMIMN